jgi:hypothetical protein
LQLLEKRFPGIQRQTEVTDVATPVTTEGFTGGQTYEANWGFMGMLTFIRSKPRTLPTLKNFFLVGGAAGLPGCAALGRNTIEQICKNKHVKFTPNK